ncbi:MAG: hypothetical protein ACI3W7_01880 [Oscillospiraceae bacterium]
MDGFSADGYIIDQNFMAGYPYRGMTSDINGCGWIAAYNLRHAAGQDVAFDDVCGEMNRMYVFRIPGPTPMRKLRRYLRRYLPHRYTAGRKRAQAAAGESAAGILRYWEGDVPHFISFVRQNDGRYRFLNVADGKEDFLCSMEEFFETRVHKGWIRTLTIE